ncbi:TonB-dependent receptor plug domain-containing protein [Paraflavitalea speifideaquila]|uniref:TonB-dependent receptor plug domain-containing protein n=1 Tax=Paraflavitalea speifideaquila TaxID=3076558 RepID=UPI0028EC933F|nr:TonB-dependent receptor plug domain-containing protein [Paraflavitalea speifideiaquila]
MVGSVSQISGDVLKQAPAMNVTNMLAGRLPGVTTVQQSGRPGADDAMIRIRGIGTYNSSTPSLLLTTYNVPLSATSIPVR